MDSLLSLPTSLPRTVEIQNVPFINQEAGHCGPATLTMALQSVGNSADLSKITSQVFIPGMKGSLQADMIGATRRQGALAIPIQNLENLLTEVAAGNPVIVFENLALSWLPQWHYALVYGYDLDRQEVIMHSGPEKGKRWDLRKFERSWKLGDYWGLIVLPPNFLSATANELAHIAAASALENIGLVENAHIAYQTILTRWPKSLGALIGSGNTYFAKKKYSEAAKNLSLAITLYPESALAWHNLAIAQKLLNQSKAAKISALKAMSLATELQKAQYQKSLKEIF